MVVFTITNVGEETFHDRGGDDIAYVVGLRVPLEGDTHDFSILNDRSAGVAGVDGGIDLNDKVGIRAGVAVATEVDSGNNTLGDGETLSSDRIANCADPAFKFGHAADFKVREALERLNVLKLDEGEVTVMCNVTNASDVFLG
jgi:hypothetical protein